MKPLEVKHLHSLPTKSNKKVVVCDDKNHLATLERHNCIGTLQAKATHSQSLHVFALHTDAAYSKWRKYLWLAR